MPTPGPLRPTWSRRENPVADETSLAYRAVRGGVGMALRNLR